MPHLVGTEGLAAGAMFTLSLSETTVGRDAENDIALMDRAVSLCHARLVLGSDGQVFVRAEQGAGVILVNGVPVSPAPLSPGDLLQIGDTVFRFEA